jgi:hypothetical protein
MVCLFLLPPDGILLCLGDNFSRSKGASLMSWKYRAVAFASEITAFKNISINAENC